MVRDNCAGVFRFIHHARCALWWNYRKYPCDLQPINNNCYLISQVFGKRICIYTLVKWVHVEVELVNLCPSSVILLNNACVMVKDGPISSNKHRKWAEGECFIYTWSLGRGCECLDRYVFWTILKRARIKRKYFYIHFNGQSQPRYHNIECTWWHRWSTKFGAIASSKTSPCQI